MKKKILAIISVLVIGVVSLTGCTEADQVTTNLSQEADNFNITRKITVMNTLTDTVMFEMIGTFALKNNAENELEVICETSKGQYKKHFIYLNKFTTYVVEDVTGADVDKYHYELNFLPEWGLKITHND